MPLLYPTGHASLWENFSLRRITAVRKKADVPMLKRQSWGKYDGPALEMPARRLTEGKLFVAAARSLSDPFELLGSLRIQDTFVLLCR